MLLEFPNIDFYDDYTLGGMIEWQEQEAILLTGDNGVGKSSLIQLFKLNRDQYFQEMTCRFVDQGRLAPLNQISFSTLCQQFKSHQSQDLEIFQEILQQIDYAHKPINQLSGGQNQMVKILWSLYLGGDLFFFDEPLLNLDDKNILLFENIISKLKAKKRVFLIEHRNGPIFKLCDRVFEMQKKGLGIEVVESHGKR